MGTRNLTCVVADGEYRIAQYGQWDGYPSGQGLTILRFLKEEGNLAKLREALPKLRFLDAEGRDKAFMEEYNNNAPEWSSDPDNRTPEQKAWFERFISRNLGGEILTNVANADDYTEVVLRNSVGFAGDSLFCKYAYVVDLDKNTFEVYEGFNSEPITEGRFISGDETLEAADGYEPVKMIQFYFLDALPSEEGFLQDLEPSDEDDE